jgi:hypothetical protein
MLMWVKIAAFLSILAIVVVITSIVIGYYLLRYVYKELSTDHFSDYSRETKASLAKYHDAVIKRAYVMRRRIPRQWLAICYISYFLLSEEFNKHIFGADVFHHSILIEIETEHGPRLLIVEKTDQLVIRDSVRITLDHTLEPLKLSTEDSTLQTVFDGTKKAMGDESFFNWRIDSTCQHLVHAMAKELDPNNDPALPNDYASCPQEEAYIINKFMYYYFKAARMMRLDKQILKYVT